MKDVNKIINYSYFVFILSVVQYKKILMIGGIVLEKILLDNAFCSWKYAIKFCDYILEGRSTFFNLKKFISNLHNAVELFLKQLMLNETDYRVVEIIKSDKDGKLARDYYTSSDLNKFFKEHYNESRRFYSIKYSNLIKICKEYFDKFHIFNDELMSTLELLNQKRNNETHFYIDPNDFLSEKDFLQLYKFMLDFYKMLSQASIFPFIGKPDEANMDFCISRNISENFSYKNAILDSKVLQYLRDKSFDVFLNSDLSNDSYYISKSIYMNICDEHLCNFDDLTEYIEVALKFGFIVIHGENEFGEKIIKIQVD